MQKSELNNFIKNVILLILCALFLIFIFSFGFNDNIISSKFKNGDKFSSQKKWPLIKKVLTKKMRIFQKISEHGHKNLTSIEPLNMDSLWLMFNYDEQIINCSLTDIKIYGLSRLKVKDIATNPVSRSLSVLLGFPNIQINGKYHIVYSNNDTILYGYNDINSNNRLQFLLSNTTRSLLDENNDHKNEDGIFNIEINDWSTSWFSQLVDIDENKEMIKVKKIVVKSYYDIKYSNFSFYPFFSFSSLLSSSSSFSSYSTSTPTSTSTYLPSTIFLYKDNNHQVSKKLYSLVPMILRKAGNQIDKSIENILKEIINEQILNEQLLAYDDLLNFHHSNRKRRQVPCEPGSDLDEYVDSLFRFASRIVRAMEPIGLPNATVDLPEYNLQFFLYKGGASRAFTLNRKKPAWVYCSNESISLGLTIGFESLRIKYKYRAIKDWKLLFDGELEADLQDTKIQIQFTQTTPEENSDEEVQQRVDRLRIWRLGRVRIILKGLGNFTQAVSMLLSSILNSEQDQLNPSLRRVEKEVVEYMNEQLKNVTIPFFSII